jgi:serine/threonine protein phosphatase 1
VPRAGHAELIESTIDAGRIKEFQVPLETSITGPVAVIGDVHGQVDQLARILEHLRELPDYDRRWIVFIGDLVDRGPDSKGAIDLVLDLMLHHGRTTVVAGNHELAMSAALGLVETPEYSDWPGRWIDHYGSEATFRSYGLETPDLAGLFEQLPQSHRELLADVPWSVEHPEFFFVHAGLDPNSSFAMQREILRVRDFTLNRPPWLCSKRLPFEEPPQDCPRVVVSGHVKVPQVQFGRKRILVDTTGGEGGSMSCVLLPENRVIHSDPHARTARSRPEPVKKNGWFW